MAKTTGRQVAFVIIAILLGRSRSDGTLLPRGPTFCFWNCHAGNQAAFVATTHSHAASTRAMMRRSEPFFVPRLIGDTFHQRRFLQRSKDAHRHHHQSEQLVIRSRQRHRSRFHAWKNGDSFPHQLCLNRGVHYITEKSSRVLRCPPAANACAARQRRCIRKRPYRAGNPGSGLLAEWQSR